MKKGYVLLEVVATMVCIMVLTVPIIKTINLINKDKVQYEENRNTLKVMEFSKEYIEDADDETQILQETKIEDYVVNIFLDEKINDNLYKYNVKIEKNSELKAEFYIIKRY